MAIPKRVILASGSSDRERNKLSYQFSGQAREIQKLCVSYDFYMAFRRLELDERKIEGWDYVVVKHFCNTCG